ncbi:Hypothetical protein ZOSMA_269G00060 [Zostera marina]|uniref:Uncharacterized protein n=1 Tax=Zostera marina TaxID=29655 RepID=A0A0K9PGQ1_ZOSMR|nr:Hypothetical protein ZOSMA_269G00060 [Zostera marina]
MIRFFPDLHYCVRGGEVTGDFLLLIFLLCFHTVSSPLTVASDGLRATVPAVSEAFAPPTLVRQTSTMKSDCTFLEFLDSLYKDVLSRSPVNNSPSPFQPGIAAANVTGGVAFPTSVASVPHGATQAELATRRVALPSTVSVARSTLSVPMSVDPLPVPQFYSAPLTSARWNAATEFGREVGLHNPEWKTLQSIPCSTLLEGAIATNLNSLLPLKAAYAQVTYLVSENANYCSEIDRVNAKCDALALKLEATMKYCEDLSLKLQERQEADLEN